MHMIHLPRFWGHLPEQKSNTRREGECQIEFEHYSNSHVCVLVSDVSIKINHDSSVPSKKKNPSNSLQHKYRGEKRGGGRKYIPGMFFFFFSFLWRGEETGEKERADTAVNWMHFSKWSWTLCKIPPGAAIIESHFLSKWVWLHHWPGSH